MENTYGPSEEFEGYTSPVINVVCFWGVSVTAVVYPDATSALDATSKNLNEAFLEHLMKHTTINT